METIACLGLGAMGSRMAHRLRDAGYDLVVYNRSEEASAALVARGARRAATPAQAVSGATMVLSMLTDDEASCAVWDEPERGAFAGVRQDTLLLESSTLSVGRMGAWARRAEEHGALAVAAPVAGSTPQAEAGALIHFVGTRSQPALERAKPVLEVLGQAAHHVGGVEDAAFVKLAVNSIFSAQVCVLGEVLGRAKGLGMDVGALIETLNQTPVISPALKGIASLILHENRQTMFPIHLVEKDVRYMLQAAAAQRSPCLEAVRQEYERACEQGLGDRNIHDVAQLHMRERA